MDDEELARLLPLACAGDGQALAALIERLRGRVRLRAQGLLGPRLGARLDASDVAQEVCLRAYRAFGQFDGHTVPQLLAWVEGALQNYLADCWRHHGAGRRDAGREEAGDLVHDLAANTASPSEHFLQAEQRARLEEALRRLPGRQRLVFELRFVEQLPFAEVGRRAGISEGNARVLFLRTTERLRKELREDP
jgi:RNA polymerase sigma-70 factor (ECF subfamily)